MEQDELEEEVEEELDLTDLGPNPTPQMIEMKKKQIAAGRKSPTKGKATTGKSGSGSRATKSMKARKVVVVPPKPQFTGNKNNAIYLMAADVLDKTQGALELAKLRSHVGPSFNGANLTFVHTYTDWSPTDIFGLAMDIKKLNRKAELDSFLMLFGCGISDIHLFREALYRHTKHVQLVVFEKQDLVRTQHF